MNIKQFNDKKQELKKDIKGCLSLGGDCDNEVLIEIAMETLDELQLPKLPKCVTCKYFNTEFAPDACLSPTKSATDRMWISHPETWGCTDHSDYEVKNENN